MKKKTIFLLMMVLICSTFFCFTVFGSSGSVSSAIQGSWTSAKTEIKTVVDNVVFPALSFILAILFFVKLGGAYFDYRKHGQFEFTAPLIPMSLS